MVRQLDTASWGRPPSGLTAAYVSELSVSRYTCLNHEPYQRTECSQKISRRTTERTPMKRLPLFLLYTLLSIPAVAQQPDSIQRDAISKLNWLAGQWKGEGFAEYRPGQRSYVNMTETIEPRLNGTVLYTNFLTPSWLTPCPLLLLYRGSI